MRTTSLGAIWGPVVGRTFAACYRPFRVYSGGMGLTTLEVKELTYHFTDTGRGCTDVSFTATSGFLTVLAGPSGCGKSTALAAAAGLLAPQSGSVLFQSTPILPGTCALVLQSAQVFEKLTAWENVACSWGVPTRRSRDRAIAVLADYGLADVADSRPDQMSGGQRQRVALVSALVQNKPILFADEATSHLDEANARVVIETLRSAAQHRVVVVASHDERLCGLADRLVGMSPGVHHG